MVRFQYRNNWSDLTTATHCGLGRTIPQFQYLLNCAIVVSLHEMSPWGCRRCRSIKSLNNLFSECFDAQLCTSGQIVDRTTGKILGCTGKAEMQLCIFSGDI